MKEKWQAVHLGQYFKLKHGWAFKGKFFAKEGKYILLTPGNFNPDGGIKLKGDKEKYYTGDFPEKFLLKYDDLLVVMTDLTQDAPILGSPAFITENDKFLHNQRLGKVVDLDETQINRTFLYYLFNASIVRNRIKATANGTTVKHTSPDRIYNVEVNLPSLPIQQKIAAVLRPYDKLIENNTRRIQILEEMAQIIYRQWFVEFQFPGHENVPMVESELGMIPQGWEVKILGDLCNVVPGYAFKSKDWQDTGVGVVKIKNIKSDNTIDIQDADCISSDILSPKLDKYQLITGDFLIAMTGATAGKVGRLRTKTPMMLNQRVAKFDPIDAYRDYVWCKVSIKETQQDFFRLADGTAQPNMSGSQIENYKIVCPPSSVCNHFSSVVGAMLIQSDNLMLRNINLRKTRDLLLPKLISGELDVSELDINIDGIQPRKGGTPIPYPLTERLHSDEKILGGKPVIRGTRLAVAFILELLENGWSEAEVLENYPSINREDIDACLAYQQQGAHASVRK